MTSRYLLKFWNTYYLGELKKNNNQNLTTILPVYYLTRFVRAALNDNFQRDRGKTPRNNIISKAHRRLHVEQNASYLYKKKCNDHNVDDDDKDDGDDDNDYRVDDDDNDDDTIFPCHNTAGLCVRDGKPKRGGGIKTLTD